MIIKWTRKQTEEDKLRKIEAWARKRNKFILLKD